MPVQVSLGCHTDGVALPHANPNDPDTIEAGVRKRFLLTPPEPNKELLSEFSAFVSKWCRENLTPLSPVADCTLEAWLAKTNYPEKRRLQLKSLFEERNGLLTPKDFVVKSFMKDETYPEYKHARGINSRTDMFKCVVGPIFRLIEEQVFKHPAFIKKVPVADRPAYIYSHLQREGAKYFYGDFTSFESHFTRQMMDACEFVLYEYMTSKLPEGAGFMKLVRDVIGGHNHCVYKFFGVDVEARRMSGEMNTSLGNGFTNLMLILFLFSRVGEVVTPIVEGDDSATSYMHRCPTAADFAQLGFTIKCGSCDSFEELSFCGMVFDPVDLINVTDPRDVLASFGWARSVYARSGRKKKLMLLRCKALSYAHQYPGCPIIQALAHYALRVTKSHDVRHFVANDRHLGTWERDKLLAIISMDGDKASRLPFKPVPPRTRELVSRLYGLSVEFQFQIEEYLNSLNELTPLRGPVRLVDFDQSNYDYFERYGLTLDRFSAMFEYPEIHWAQTITHERDW